MLFNSVEFFLFFFITIILYYSIPKKHQWFLILAASCFFYMFLVPYLILLVFITIINDYTAGLLMEKYNSKKIVFLIESIILNLCILFFFKYFNFFAQNLNTFSKLIGWNYSLPLLKIMLPIGLSFYIFKSISYVIEVYRGNKNPEKNIGIYTLYIIFFPEILAGPIDRPKNLIDQFHQEHSFDYDNVTYGLKLIAWGVFKKVVIADRLAISVNFIFSHLHEYHGLPLMISIFFFAFQIYCDFSGYSDIAIGVGRVMGFKLMKNFDKPYFAHSIAEFWKRWHISLSTWFRDYFFLPIAYKSIRIFNKPSYAGMRKDTISYSIATIFTLFAIGLWHGANWTFIIWGLLIGIYLIISVLTKKLRNRFIFKKYLKRYKVFYKVFQIFITFILICISWIFFRSDNIQDAFYIITHIFTGFKLQLGGYNLGLGQFQVILSFLFIIILIIVEYFTLDDENVFQFTAGKALWVRWAAYYFVICTIICFGKFGESSFLYFKF